MTTLDIPIGPNPRGTDAAGRLLDVLALLTQGFATVDELAKVAGVSRRTAWRLLELLRARGAPLVSDATGAGGRARFFLPPADAANWLEGLPCGG